MSRRVVALVAVLGILASGGRSFAANIAFFNDGGFGDLTEENPRLRTVLVDSLSQTVTNFSGTAAANWEAALQAADIVVIPELTNDLFLAMPVDTRSALVGFVLSGGGLITDNNSEMEQFLNGLFGYGLVLGSPAPRGGGSGNPTTLNAAAAAGTPFEGGPASLPPQSLVGGFQKASLPPGALSLYEFGGVTSVFTVNRGAGRIVFLGFDWFELPPSPAWVSVLGSAITHASNSIPQGLTLAVFEDPTYYGDPGEIANLKTDYASFGDTVIPFTGVSAAEWRAAITRADILVLPEVEDGNLPLDLPAETKTLIGNFVLSGRGLVVHTDFNAAPTGHLVQIMNSVFGFSISQSGAGTSNLTGAATGTPFEDGPPELTAANATKFYTTASLPPGSLSFYTFSGNSSVVGIQRGFGKIVFLGYDWFDTPSPLAWRGVLHETLDAVGSGPPNIAVNAPAVNVGATAQVTVDLSGFSGLSLANLRFRPGGDASFLTVGLVQSAPTTWSATIPGSSVNDKGLQFFLDLGDGTNAGTSPPLAPEAGHFHNLPVNLTNFPVASLPANSYRLNGLQARPQDTNPVAVFDELGGYDIKKWRYGTFDGSAYHEPGSGAANAVPGQGYWIIAKNAANIGVNGTTADLSGPLSITLHQGFNQIASPFNFPVDFADVVRPAEVENNLIGFDGSGYTPGVTVLQPGQGYWLKNNGPGTRVISIPALGSGVAAAPRAPVNFAEGADWSIRVDAYAGPFNDRGNLFGTRAEAADGRDAFDLSDPPPAPQGWAQVALASASEGALFADWRPTANDGDTWQVTFASDQSGEPFRIELVTEHELPAGWDVAAFEGSREVSLGDARQITGVVGSTTAPRTFTVAAGNATYLERARVEAREQVTTFALAAPFPNPTSTGVTMDLALPAPVADALVNVYDVQGRLVKTLLRGDLDRGVQRIAWDGRAGSGERVSAGVYFVKARAGEFTASRKVVLLP